MSPAAHDKQTFRYAAVIAVGALLYYFLGGFIIALLADGAIPESWLTLWSSRLSGLLAWVQLLNVGACLIAAAPVALGIVWIIPAYRQLVAFAVSTLTVSVVVARLFDSEMSPGRGADAAYWINFGVLTLAFLLAVPLLVSALCTLRRRLRTPRARSPH